MYDYYSVVTNSLPKFVCLREHFFGGEGWVVTPRNYTPGSTLNNAYMSIFGLQPRDKAAMLEAKTTDFLSKNLHENGV